MKQFHYRAKTSEREIVEGDLVAESQDDAVARISDMGLLPVDVMEKVTKTPQKALVTAGSSKSKISYRDLTLFYRHLGKLLKSGVPLLHAFQLLQEETTHQNLKDLLENLRRDIHGGEALSALFAMRPDVFSPFEVAMTQAGESIGRLDEVFLQVARYREDQENLHTKVRMAFVYPAFVLGIGVLTIGFVMSYVIPQFSRFFLDFGQELPFLTKGLIVVSQWVQKTWLWVLSACAVGSVFFIRALRSREFKRRWDQFCLSIPKLRDLMLKYEIARFARSLSLLLSSGISVLRGLRIAAPVMQNEVLRDEIRRCYESVEKGSSLSDEMRKSDWFPPFVVHFVRLGEESGKLDESLAEVAGWFEQETSNTVEVLTKLLEPVTILAVGLIVGLIVVAVLLPIFDMNTVIT